MPLDPQNLLVYAVVLMIVGAFGWSLARRRRRRNPGCGADCGCTSGVKRNPVIEKIVARNTSTDNTPESKNAPPQ